ncbi:MAG TPA: GatB/YqeY domain-containing protein [Candidatus Nanoarchaeia archaeon]|nr:GatB/YqeY domain-containing protein [Candidatus Nanoarchaeia archaeon]
MELVARIDQDMTEAMKANEVARLGVLRLLKNSLKNEQIKLKRDLTDDEALKVLQREAKQRKDSIEAYEKGDRPDLASVEALELKMIEEYLPQQLSEADVAKLVDEAITAIGATTPAQMGQIIGYVMKQAGGAADGGLVSRLARARLNG